MNFQHQIAKRILDQRSYKNKVSKPIVKIGIIGISLGVAVMILTMAIVTGFQKEIIRKITTFSPHLLINDYDLNNSLEANPIELETPVLNQLRALPGVKHVQPFATKNGILKTETENEGIVLKGISADFDWSLLKPYITRGEPLKLNDTATSNNILVSKTLADKLHLKMGQKLLVYFMTRKKQTDTTEYGDSYQGYEPRERSFKITGIYNTGFADFDKNLVFVDLNQVRKLNYWGPKQVAGYEIYLNDFKTIDAETEVVNDLVGYNYTVSSVKNTQANIFSWLSMVDVNAIIIIALMALVAAINMISALLILILERTNMVGILKALGMNNQALRGVFLNVSFNMLLRGLIYGNIAGIGLCFLQLYLKPFTLNPETYYLDYVPINFSLLHVILINAGTILFCLLMMFLPTIILTRITPIKAIRFS
ncbi:MAG: ABC transporter permease [Bacteroidetes bacterium]|nr:ABC transporter permease [Bacteroidota bacterium]